MTSGAQFVLQSRDRRRQIERFRLVGVGDHQAGDAGFIFGHRRITVDGLSGKLMNLHPIISRLGAQAGKARLRAIDNALQRGE